MLGALLDRPFDGGAKGSRTKHLAALKRRERPGVQCNMKLIRHTPTGAACLLAFGVYLAQIAQPAHASDFTAFAEDEDACRRVGAAAIKDASGPAAAGRYDFAHRQCMVAHGTMRQMEAYRNAAPDSAYPAGNPHSFEYPDAFYSIPYATPGYGYDGFSR
jgi:hypothetical protein